jgi:hypothetical protein
MKLTTVSVTLAGLGMSAAALAATIKAGEQASSPVYAIVDIDAVGPAKLADVLAKVPHEWFVEADRELLLLTTKQALQASPRPFRVLDVEPKAEDLYLIRMAHGEMLANLESDVLVKGGRQAIVQARTPYLESRLAHPSVEPFKPDVVLARQMTNDKLPKAVEFRPDVRTTVAQVDGARWFRDVETLATFNRYTHGTQIIQARDFLVQQLSAIPGLEVSTPSFRVGSTTTYNVVAKLTGTTRPDEWYVVGGHYDSTSQSPRSTAPGAEDNASGAAGVVEMARALAAAHPAATIWFVAFSGEEQGLYGGEAFAGALQSDGNAGKVKGVINMDMIGYTEDADLDCLLETDRRGAAALNETLSAAAAEFTSLRIVTSLNPWGSDHVPFIDRGMPAVLTIENDYEDYPAYHRTTDTIDNVNQAMGEETLKMNVAALAQWAGG